MRASQQVRTNHTMYVQEQKKHQIAYSFPQTKLRNITCVHCKHQFWVRDISLSGTHLPLLMECGHATCEGCSKDKEICPICNVALHNGDGRKLPLPLNVFALGLAVVSQNYSKMVDDPDVSFCPSVGSKLRQLRSQSFCHECGILATLQCEQCNAPYCSLCFSKIHKRALQNHKKITLLDADGDNSFAITNTCSNICSDSLEYYCTECEESVCSHCMIRLHPKHDYILQQNKNEELLPEFQEACDSVAENLQRVFQAQKKVKKMSVLPSKLQDSERVEASINRHFAHLHGVLQNLEKTMIDRLQQQRNYVRENLDDIFRKLAHEEEQLQAALLMAGSAKESLATINLKEVIDKLNKFKNIPCHLVEDVVQEDAKLEFEVDKSIIGALEKHCTVKIPPPIGFNLMQAENLPEDYKMEPLTENVHIQNFLEGPLTVSLKSSSSVESYDLPKPNNPSAIEGTTSVVKVSHIDSPERFYVLPLYNVEQYKELCRSLQLHGSLISRLPTDIAVNKLYVFLRPKDKKWWRGRVQEIHTDSTGQIISCEMFCIDIGCVQLSVSVNQIRDISPKLAVLPPLVKKCRLHEIVPSHGRWGKEATQHLVTMTKRYSRETVSMHVMKEYGDTYSVDLYINCNSGERPTSVRDSLVYLGFGNFATEHKLLRLNPQSVYKYYEDELELDKYVDVVCLNVESPESIYVRKIGENRAHFDKVMDELNTDYSNNLSSKAIIYTPEVGLPCAAQDRNGRWCRGLITGIGKYQKSVQVFFVDTGHKASIQFDSIRRLQTYYMKCRTQAIRVSTRDVKCPEPDGRWSESTVKMLEIYLMKQPFKVIAVEKKKDSYSVRILFNENANLSNLMISSDLAHSKPLMSDVCSQKKYKSTVWKNRKAIKNGCTATDVGSGSLKNIVSDDRVEKKKIAQENQDPFKIYVRVHRVDSPDSIYVSDRAYEETNVNLMSTLQDFYSKYCSNRCNIWETGAVCVAYIVAEKLYYRARITDVKSPEEVTVYLYDLGTTEIVATKDIQPLHPSFAEVPAYLFKVKLAGLLPCGGSSRWPSVSCEKLASIIDENQNCKFYISRMLDAEDEQNVDDKGEMNEITQNKAIAVELWLKQSKTDGPLSPTRIEINSVNRMLLDEGLALPNKKLAEKRVKMLATDLQRKLEENYSLTPKWSPTVKWMLIKDELSDSSETFTDNLPQTPRNSSDSDSENDEDETSIARIATWLPAEPIVENSFIALGSYVDENGALYVHHKERNSKILANMEAELANYGKKVPLSPCDMEWYEGDVCIAQYHNNKKWYRAKVNKVHGDDVEVEFVDYGNVEKCALGTLKKKILFENVPIQCTKCIIHGLEPATEDGKWLTEDLDKMHVVLVEHELTVQVLDRKPNHLVVSIKIHHLKEQDLINYLYHKQKLSIKMPCPLNITLNSTITNVFGENLDNTNSPDVIIDEYISLCGDQSIEKNTVLELSATEYIHTVDANNDDVVSGSPTIVKLSKKLKNVEEMTSQFENLTWADIATVDENVIVSSTPQNKSCECFQTSFVPLNIPNDITIMEIELCCPDDTTVYYGQLRENEDNAILHAYYEQFKLLMETLQKNACKQPKLKTIEYDALCCAQFHDGLWYRCIVKDYEIINENKVSVGLQFVDYGNSEYRIVDLNDHDLYTLNEEWLTLPCMALKFKLWGIEVHPDETFESLQPKLEEIYNKLIIAKIKERKDGCFEVELYPDKNCTGLLYSSFIEEGSFIIKKTKED